MKDNDNHVRPYSSSSSSHCIVVVEFKMKAMKSIKKNTNEIKPKRKWFGRDSSVREIRLNERKTFCCCLCHFSQFDWSSERKVGKLKKLLYFVLFFYFFVPFKCHFKNVLEMKEVKFVLAQNFNVISFHDFKTTPSTNSPATTSKITNQNHGK